MSELPVPRACVPARPRSLAAVPSTSRVRLTRRGRLVVLLVLSILLLVAFSVGRVSSRADGPGRARPVPTVVVRAGDTLWSIARRAAPGQDPRVVVARIVSANRLDGATVLVGQRLAVPRS